MNAVPFRSTLSRKVIGECSNSVSVHGEVQNQSVASCDMPESSQNLSRTSKVYCIPDDPNACDCNDSDSDVDVETVDEPMVSSQNEISIVDHMRGGGVRPFDVRNLIGIEGQQRDPMDLMGNQGDPMDLSENQRGPTDPQEEVQSDPTGPSDQQGGKAPEKSPKKRPLLEYFEIRHQSDESFFSEKIKMTSWTFMGIKGQKNLSLSDNMPAFHDLLVKIMDDFLEGKDPEDKVQVVLASKYDGKHPVSTKIMTVKNFSVSHVMAAIAGSVTSGATWRVSDEIEVQIKHVKMKDSAPQSSAQPENPGGARRRYVVENASLSAKQRNCIVKIKNEEDLMCAPRAVVVIKAKKHLDKMNETSGVTAEQIAEAERAYREAKESPFHQARIAAELCELAGVKVEFPCGVSEIKKFENALGIYIKIVGGDVFSEIVYDGVLSNRRDDVPVTEENVYFLYRTLIIKDKKDPEDEANFHFDAIVNRKAFFNEPHFCLFCNKRFRDFGKHKCDDIKEWCYSCFSRECPPLSECCVVGKCADCGVSHRSDVCREMHDNNSKCKKNTFCPKCRTWIKRELDTKTGKLETPSDVRKKHVCLKKCKVCKKDVEPLSHTCFHQPTPFKPPTPHRLYFDYETDQSTGVHLPIFFHCRWVNGVEDQDQNQKSFWIKDYDMSPRKMQHEIGKFLFSKQFEGYTMIAHNMKAFDGCFLLRYMSEVGLMPTLIFSGRKIMSMSLKNLGIRIIDSLNFIPMSLAAMVKSFGLENLIGNKGFFPHFFSKPENYDYVGELPPMEEYGALTMTEKHFNDFSKWYNQIKATVPKEEQLNFAKDIATYCIQDVDVLLGCCEKFRSDCMAMHDNECDPFRYTTIASLASAVFKAKFLKADKIAAVPPNGYASVQNFSSKSLEWLEFTRQNDDKVSGMLHILNSPTGEIEVAGYRVDGFDEKTKTVFEFHGCYFHGCFKCFPNRSAMNKNAGQTFGSLFAETMKKEGEIKKAGWNLVTMWECEWERVKAEKPEIVQFVHENQFQLKPMSPFDAFFGGRVETFQMKTSQKRCHYIDVTSLYPSILASKRFPVGHPQIITNNFGDPKTAPSRFFGIMKCAILPPKQLHIPVLPGKYGKDGKLLFTLCRTCATERQSHDICLHDSSDRVLLGTWFTPEIELAVEMGYRVLEVFQVYHFEESSTELFEGYIKHFYKMKLTASGVPSKFKTREEVEQFCRDVSRIEGIEITPDQLEDNPGLRQLGKLLINSHWGRFGLKRFMKHYEMCTDIRQVRKILNDPESRTSVMVPLQENVTLMGYDVAKAEFLEMNGDANIFIAVATTSWARVTLYNFLRRLDDRVVYCDTDSVIYEDLPGHNIELGSFLGEMTSELKEGDFISEFVSAGPKTYAYITEGGDTCVKAKGFSLNKTNKEAFCFENLEKIIEKFASHTYEEDADGDDFCRGMFDNETDRKLWPVKISSNLRKKLKAHDELRQKAFRDEHSKNPNLPSAFAGPDFISVFNPSAIVRNAKFEILSKSQQKLFTVNYDKRVVLDNFMTIPYGY